MTLFDLILKDVRDTLTRPLTEPLVLRFTPDDWEFLIHEAAAAQNVQPEEIRYTAPLRLHSKWGVVALRLLIPLPPNTKEDYH